MKRMVVGLLLVALSACGPDPDMPMYRQSANARPVSTPDSSRIEVTRIGVFADDLAYGGKRGVYIIKDVKTGQEFVGISGVGVSSTGSHLVGKVTTQDER